MDMVDQNMVDHLNGRINHQGISHHRKDLGICTLDNLLLLKQIHGGRAFDMCGLRSPLELKKKRTIRRLMTRESVCSTVV